MFLPATIVLNFIGEVVWPTSADVATGIISIEESSFRFGQGMFDGERSFATSESVFVSIDEVGRRPKIIPDSIRGWLNGYSIG